jgi:ribosome maturation factor RimP
MVRSAKERELIAVLEPAAIAHGLQLVECEMLTQAGQAVVRVYLEPDDESGLIDIETLASANAWIDPLVVSASPYQGAYTLEVSSPGINRPLRTHRHFQRFIGETVKMRTEPIDGRANWTGQLAGVTEDAVLLTLDNQTVQIAMDKIKRTYLQAVF